MSQRGAGAGDVAGFGYGPVVGATSGPTDSFHYYGKVQPPPFSSSFPTHTSAPRPAVVKASGGGSEWMVNSGGSPTTGFNLNPSAAPFKLAAASDTSGMLQAMAGMGIRHQHQQQQHHQHPPHHGIHPGAGASWGGGIAPMQMDLSAIHSPALSPPLPAAPVAFMDYANVGRGAGPMVFTTNSSGGVLAAAAPAGSMGLHARPQRVLPPRTHAGALSQEELAERPGPPTRRYRMRMLPPPLSLERHRGVWCMNHAKVPRRAAHLSGDDLEQLCQQPESEDERRRRLEAYQLVAELWFHQVDKLACSEGAQQPLQQSSPPPSLQSPQLPRCPSLGETHARVAASGVAPTMEAVLVAWSADCAAWWESRTQGTKLLRAGAAKKGEATGLTKTPEGTSPWTTEGSQDTTVASSETVASEQHQQAGAELDITRLQQLLAELSTEDTTL